MKVFVLLGLVAAVACSESQQSYVGYNYYGKFEGRCGYDGLYYRDDKSFVFCSNYNSYVQPCSPGTRNSAYSKFQKGKKYNYRDFCDVNLVDAGYTAQGKYGYKEPEPKKDDYAPPKNDYAAPKQEYAAPKQEYAAPKQEYAAPKTEYVAPSYQAPKNTYSAPSHGYAAPAYKDEDNSYESKTTYTIEKTGGYGDQEYSKKKTYSVAEKKDYDNGYGYGYERYGYEKYPEPVYTKTETYAEEHDTGYGEPVKREYVRETNVDKYGNKYQKVDYNGPEARPYRY